MFLIIEQSILNLIQIYNFCAVLFYFCAIIIKPMILMFLIYDFMLINIPCKLKKKEKQLRENGCP